MIGKNDSAAILMSSSCQTARRELSLNVSARHRFAARACVVVLLALGIVALFLLDPSNTRYFPRCPIFAITGLKCPGCGASRALHAALHCHFAEVLRFNAALPVLLLLFVYCVIFPLRAQRPVFIWLVIAFAIIWSVARNILGM